MLGLDLVRPRRPRRPRRGCTGRATGLLADDKLRDAGIVSGAAKSFDTACYTTLEMKRLHGFAE